MTPQEVDNAVERVQLLCGRFDKVTDAAIEALLAERATLKSENEQLRGKVGELEDRTAGAERALGHEIEIKSRAIADFRAAEAQLATLNERLAEVWQAGWDAGDDQANPYRHPATQPQIETIQGEVGREFPNAEPKEPGT